MSARGLAAPLLVLLALLSIAPPAHAVRPGAAYALDPRATGLLVEDVHFPSARDSVRLDGWWFAGRPNMPVLVACPRGSGTMADLIPSVVEWARRGYAVLTYDLRDFGPSSAGPQDSLADVVFASRWVDDTEGAFVYARRRAAGSPVFAWGQDLGGPLALVAAARRHGMVDGLAVEGLFRTAQEQLLWLGTSRNIETVRRHRELVNESDDPISALARLRTPLFVVIAGKDEVTPPDVTRAMTASFHWAKVTWELPDAKHDGAERSPGYFDHIGEWIDHTAAVAKRQRH